MSSPSRRRRHAAMFSRTRLMLNVNFIFMSPLADAAAMRKLPIYRASAPSTASWAMRVAATLSCWLGARHG